MVVMTPGDTGTEPGIGELTKKVDEGFAQANEKMDKGFARVNSDIRELRRDTKAGLEKLDEKFDRKFDRLTFHLLTGAMAMITALLGVIATCVVTIIHVL
jgi:hypothetical protein